MLKFGVIVFVLSFTAAHVHAEEVCDASDSKALFSCVNKTCPKGSALDQASCFSDALKRKEKVMNALIEAAISDYTSMWGKEAVSEGQQRIRASQNYWEQYRDADCLFGYYTHAPSHPPSGDLKVNMCKLQKTMARIAEIQSFQNYNRTD